jgi:integrase
MKLKRSWQTLSARRCNGDVCGLKWSHLDLDGAWVNFPRPKTGIYRKAAPWPETVEALNALPRLHVEVFRTKYGRSWNFTAVGHEFAKVCAAAGIADEEGRGFYGLRRTFRTAAASAKSDVVARAVMGHTQGGMEEFYVVGAQIDDQAFRELADHVRKKLIA